MKTDKLIAGGLFVASLLLYISTLAPSVVTIFDDSLEFQLVTYQLGIAHPTGYPLYTLLGKLFTFIPIGNVAYRVNVMSAVFGAATVALVYRLILKIVRPQGDEQSILHPPHLQKQGGGRLPNWPIQLGGIIGALLLATGSVFWQQATVAEVYTLNAFFIVALLLLVTNLPHLEVMPARVPGQKQPGILWLLLLAGLSLTHHRTMLLLFPAVAIYLYPIYKSQLFKPKLLLLGVSCFLLPLLLYLYLPWRGHIGSLDGTYQNSWAGFWQQVSGSGYGLFIFDNPFGHDRDFLFYWNLLANQFYTTVPGLIGLAYLFLFGQRKMLILTGLAFLSYLTFNLFYTVTDIDVFFIPNFLLWAIWSGAGATFLLFTAAGIKLAALGRPSPSVPSRVKEDLETITEEPISSPRPVDPAGPRQKRYVKLILIGANLAIFTLILFQLSQPNWITINQSHTSQVHHYGLDILQQPIPGPSAGGSAIVGILGEMTLIRYFQQTENRRPDIETVAADLEAERLVAVENLLSAGQAVYLTRELPGAPERWSLSAVGPLIRVHPEPIMVPPEFSFVVNQAVTPEITLLGYNLSQPLLRAGQKPASVRLTLFWQVNAPIEADLKVSARLLSPSGTIVSMTDATPVHFAYPTSSWRSGEIISDVYDLDVPVHTPPGQYTPLIIWYDPAQNAAEIGRIELERLTII